MGTVFRPGPLRPSSRGLILICLLSAPVPAWAQDPPAAAQAANPAGTQPPWYHDLAVNAFLSVAYSYNFNAPASRTNQFRVFDFDDRSFKLDAAEMVVQKPVSTSGEVGFRVDAMVGASIPRVTAVAGYARYTFTPRLAVAIRAERFADPDGVRTGVVQRLTSFTLTPEIKPGAHLAVRADIRIDHSDADVFETAAGPARHQSTVALNTVCFF
jgi:hypothetical protein